MHVQFRLTSLPSFTNARFHAGFGRLKMLARLRNIALVSVTCNGKLHLELLLGTLCNSLKPAPLAAQGQIMLLKGLSFENLQLLLVLLVHSFDPLPVLVLHFEHLRVQILQFLLRIVDGFDLFGARYLEPARVNLDHSLHVVFVRFCRLPLLPISLVHQKL